MYAHLAIWSCRSFNELHGSSSFRFLSRWFWDVFNYYDVLSVWVVIAPRYTGSSSARNWCCAAETWRQAYLRRHPGDGIFSQNFSVKTPFFKNINKTRHTVLNAAMPLGDLSLLHINLQSKLIIKTNHNLPDFSAKELFSCLSVFCCLISIFYTEYIPPFVSAFRCQFILYCFIYILQY